MLPQLCVCDSQSTCTRGRTSPVAGLSVEGLLNFSGDGRLRFVDTYLVLEEGIPDVFCHCGHNQNVIWTFLIAMGVDTIVERVPVVPDQPESTSGVSV